MHAAPERRVDNLITRLHDATAMLRMHAVVMEEARAAYSSARNRYYASGGALLAAAPLASYGAIHEIGTTLQYGAGVGAVGVAAAAAAAAYGRTQLGALAATLRSDAGLDALFERCHVVEVLPHLSPHP